VRTNILENQNSVRSSHRVNFVRGHYSLGTTPAVAPELEEKPWSLEQVMEMTEAYWLRKRELA